MKKIIILFLIFSTFLFNFLFVKANDDTYLGGVEEQFSVKFSTSFPKPNETVSVSVVSYSADFNKAKITWSINDKVVVQEIGAVNFSFKMGGVNETTKLNIFITKIDGRTLQKEYYFKPSEVDLVFETETIKSPFYSGKSILTYQSAVRIYALPRFLDKQNKIIPKENLVYKWYKDDRVIQDRSGYGKDTFVWGGSIISRPFKISVEVSSLESNTIASNSLYFSPKDPKILFYEKNPVYGTMFNKAIKGNYFLDRQEVEFEVLPFSFSKFSYLNYDWKMNGKEITRPENQKYMIFRNENNESGNASVGIEITSQEKITQAAKEAFRIFFGEEAKS